MSFTQVFHLPFALKYPILYFFFIINNIKNRTMFYRQSFNFNLEYISVASAVVCQISFFDLFIISIISNVQCNFSIKKRCVTTMSQQLYFKYSELKSKNLCIEVCENALSGKNITNCVIVLVIPKAAVKSVILSKIPCILFITLSDPEH